MAVEGVGLALLLPSQSPPVARDSALWERLGALGHWGATLGAETGYGTGSGDRVEICHMRQETHQWPFRDPQSLLVCVRWSAPP